MSIKPVIKLTFRHPLRNANELDPGGFTGLGLQPQDYTDLENFMLTLTDGFF